MNDNYQYVPLTPELAIARRDYEATYAALATAVEQLELMRRNGDSIAPVHVMKNLRAVLSRRIDKI